MERGTVIASTTALCVCSWRGVIGLAAPCPACGRAATERVTPNRLVGLRAVSVRPDTPLNASLRVALIRIGAIAPAGKRPKPGVEGQRSRPPKRIHRVTELGWAVLRVWALAVEQARHDVAASAGCQAPFGCPDGGCLRGRESERSPMTGDDSQQMIDWRQGQGLCRDETDDEEVLREIASAPPRAPGSR